MTSSQFDVVFVGRANIDLTVRVPHRATADRTAFGSTLIATPGGKSLNQAIAAARRGGRTLLVTNVGADGWGDQLTTALANAGVDTRYVKAVPDGTTAAAIIEVTPDGESYITLALSPPTELTADDVDGAFHAAAARAVVVQLDLPPQPVKALLTSRRASLVIGNLVPHPELDPALLDRLDVLVLNHAEAAVVLGMTAGDPLDAARGLRRLGPGIVVVTAGAHGAAYASAGGCGMLPAPAVPVIDTTGAGDAFLGALSVALARQIPLPDAVADAVNSGSLAVQHSGAHRPAG